LRSSCNSSSKCEVLAIHQKQHTNTCYEVFLIFISYFCLSFNSITKSSEITLIILVWALFCSHIFIFAEKKIVVLDVLKVLPF
jgi:hypothetical protein